MRKVCLLAAACLLLLSTGTAWAASWRADLDNHDAGDGSYWVGNADYYYGYFAEGGGVVAPQWDADTAGSSDGHTVTLAKAEGSGRGLWFGVAGTMSIDVFQGITGIVRLKADQLVEQQSQLAIACGSQNVIAWLGAGAGNTISLQTASGGVLREEVSTVPFEGDGLWHTMALATIVIDDTDLVWDIFVDGVAQSATQVAADGSKHFYVGVPAGSDGLDTLYLGQRNWNDGAFNVDYDWTLLSQGYVPEPSCLIALGSGLLGIAGFAIRRRR